MKFLIAYNNDESDDVCMFFRFCGEEMEFNLVERSLDSVVLNPPLLTNANLLSYLPVCQVCFIANHGDSKSIAGSDGDVVSIDTDNSAFSGKLLYAVSCACAKELKNSLVRDGLRSFWGYDRELKVWSGYGQFGQCCMEGIKSLMDGMTVGEAKDAMIAQYNQGISELEAQFPNDLYLAASLLDNREALVVYGEENLRLTDLE